MRLFVAVPIGDEIRQALIGAQERLVPMAEAAGVQVKWVEPENFHLTVAFLGDLSENVIPDLSEACASIAAQTPSFRVTIAGVSIFPKPRGKQSPPIRTIWAGFSRGGDEWGALVQRAEPWFVPFGAAREGGLVPHITLGRVKAGRGEAEEDHTPLRAALAEEAATPFGEMPVDSFELMESTLAPHGATYRVLGRWAFAPATEPY